MVWIHSFDKSFLTATAGKEKEKIIRIDTRENIGKGINEAAQLSTFD